MANVKSLVLNQVPGIQYGFGSLDEPIPSHLKARWEQVRPIWKQVHGVGIAQVEEAGQSCGEVDALFTSQLDLPIAVVTADCVPVLLAHHEGRKVAAVHAGWRGTRARILKTLWNRLSQLGEKPSDWVAAIGPSIGPCCYEGSEERASDVAKEFSDLGSEKVVPRHRILDLPYINAEELRRMGLKQVDLIRACTKCSLHPQFHSYRREGGGTRQFSMVMRTP